MYRLGSRLPAFVALAILALGGAVDAQTTKARVTGVVQTPNGTRAAAARIIVADSATSAVRAGATDANGRFAIADVNPGTYTVTASLVGYRRAPGIER